jgi:hypothetical protein
MITEKKIRASRSLLCICNWAETRQHEFKQKGSFGRLPSAPDQRRAADSRETRRLGRSAVCAQESFSAGFVAVGTPVGVYVAEAPFCWSAVMDAGRQVRRAPHLLDEMLLWLWRCCCSYRALDGRLCIAHGGAAL